MVHEISLTDAKSDLDTRSALFWDIRDPASYAEAHVPGATNLGDSNAESLLGSTEHAQKIIVYCYHGNSSKATTAFLRERGFANVFSMTGGFEEWRRRFTEDIAKS